MHCCHPKYYISLLGCKRIFYFLEPVINYNIKLSQLPLKYTTVFRSALLSAVYHGVQFHTYVGFHQPPRYLLTMAVIAISILWNWNRICRVSQSVVDSIKGLKSLSCRFYAVVWNFFCLFFGTLTQVQRHFFRYTSHMYLSFYSKINTLAGCSQPWLASGWPER